MSATMYPVAIFESGAEAPQRYERFLITKHLLPFYDELKDTVNMSCNVTGAESQCRLNFMI